jgi:hypothetical protein
MAKLIFLSFSWFLQVHFGSQRILSYAVICQEKLFAIFKGILLLSAYVNKKRGLLSLFVQIPNVFCTRPTWSYKIYCSTTILFRWLCYYNIDMEAGGEEKKTVGGTTAKSFQWYSLPVFKAALSPVHAFTKQLKIIMQPMRNPKKEFVRYITRKIDFPWVAAAT